VTGPLALVDVVVIAVYLLAVIAFGLALAGRQRDASDYFLGRRDLPWWAVCLSIVATETSALTVISVPGIAARGDYTFLQLAFGYMIGRLAVAWLLLPGYFAGTHETAYQRLSSRFGQRARQVASGIFMGTRALGDGVRVFATAIPLAIVTGWSIPWSIAAVGVATLAYTYVGGLRAVVWVDVVQLGVYVIGGLAAIAVAAGIAGGLGEALAPAAAEGKLRVFDLRWDWKTTYTIASGLIGGAFLSAASHGTDHLIVQRLLATGSLRDARLALIASGVLVIAQFALFLVVGTMLWAAGADRSALDQDAIFPTFVVEQFPAGLAGLVVAGVLAAAMSTVSSSLNALASASTHDFYAPLTGRRDPRHLLTVGRWATAAWAAVLVGGAMLFRSRDDPVVEIALSIASLTYGALLGTYILAAWRRARERDAVLAIAVTAAIMTAVVFGIPVQLFPELAWPWYVPLGVAVCVGTGIVSSALPFGRRAPPPS
jgi:SSS family transporter